VDATSVTHLLNVGERGVVLARDFFVAEFSGGGHPA
jgi:hypothetical protein